MPFQLAEHHARGAADALERLGFKRAAEELRLKIPTRTFHGFDAAKRSAKKANDGLDADVLAKLLKALPETKSPLDQTTSRDPLDRSTAWGSPSNPSGGGNTDVGQPTGFGGV